MHNKWLTGCMLATGQGLKNQENDEGDSIQFSRQYIIVIIATVFTFLAKYLIFFMSVLLFC